MYIVRSMQEKVVLLVKNFWTYFYTKHNNMHKKNFKKTCHCKTNTFFVLLRI